MIKQHFLVFLLNCCLISATVHAGTISCGGVKAEIQEQPRSIGETNIFLDGKAFKLESGYSYSDPKCVIFKGEKKIAFTGGMGQQEIYRIVDLDTFQVKAITYQQAVKLELFK